MRARLVDGPFVFNAVGEGQVQYVKNIEQACKNKIARFGFTKSLGNLYTNHKSKINIVNRNKETKRVCIRATHQSHRDDHIIDRNKSSPIRLICFTKQSQLPYQPHSGQNTNGHDIGGKLLPDITPSEKEFHISKN